MKLNKSDILTIAYICVMLFKAFSSFITEKRVNESKLDDLLSKLDDMIVEDSL